ncbi:glycosyltransferase family 2 protein [Echinicola sp. 20G]|uniref:glycosyltransferase family 2 protein n=1 Tax=Echinicola sp. 20G TaxID=2781961 RepID=UPI0019105A46|nr:glycosyltransferase family 2 protein [Echinicola sp. 20G]
MPNNYNPKVSIIVPTYNYAHFIEETINNIIDQSYQNWEVIIIDDESTDNTFSVVNKIINGDNRFIYKRIKNRGNGGARNVGLDLATGDYIQFLDADDLISKNKIALQITFLKELNKNIISYSDCYYFNSQNQKKLFPDFEMKGNQWMPKFNGFDDSIFLSLIRNNFSVISSPIFSRDFIEKNHIRFNEKLKSKVDWLFWIECLIHGAELWYFDNLNANTLIRRHDISVTVEKETIQFGELTFRDQLTEVLNSSSLKRNLKDEAISLNNQHKKYLLLQILSKADFSNIKTLKTCISKIGLTRSLLYKFKLINYARKSKKTQ